MKLRTELKEIELIAAAFGLQDISHDAMAAHALMQAMDETCDAASIIWAKKRADEIMREWTEGVE